MWHNSASRRGFLATSGIAAVGLFPLDAWARARRCRRRSYSHSDKAILRQTDPIFETSNKPLKAPPGHRWYAVSLVFEPRNVGAIVQVNYQFLDANDNPLEVVSLDNDVRCRPLSRIECDFYEPESLYTKQAKIAFSWDETSDGHSTVATMLFVREEGPNGAFRIRCSDSVADSVLRVTVQDANGRRVVENQDVTVDWSRFDIPD